MPGIGTLGERSLHAALKYYYEPVEDFHEVPVGQFVADIKRGNHIIEIQTGSFNKLRRKLEVFLDEFEVTIVCPVAYVKHIEWIDEATGEVLKRRKSPKQGSCYDVFRELYKIKTFLTHPNLKLRIILLEVTERRIETRKNRKGYSRVDTFPHSVSGEMAIDYSEDYIKMIPATLGDKFTSAQYALSAKISRENAQTALNILRYIGIVADAGKSGRYKLYTVI